MVQFHQHITLPVSTYFFVLFSAKCPLLWVISFAFLHFLPSHYILYSQTLGFYHHHFTESIKIKVTNELHVANNFSFLILPDLSSAFNRVHLIYLILLMDSITPKLLVFSYPLAIVGFSYFTWNKYNKWSKTLLYVFHSSVYIVPLRDHLYSCVLKYHLYAAEFQVCIFIPEIYWTPTLYI